jgi:hypothetical protein
MSFVLTDLSEPWGKRVGSHYAAVLSLGLGKAYGNTAPIEKPKALA